MILVFFRSMMQKRSFRNAHFFILKFVLIDEKLISNAFKSTEKTAKNNIKNFLHPLCDIEKLFMVFIPFT